MIEGVLALATATIRSDEADLGSTSLAASRPEDRSPCHRVDFKHRRQSTAAAKQAPTAVSLCPSGSACRALVGRGRDLDKRRSNTFFN
jgi:hypothetical protein